MDLHNLLLSSKLRGGDSGGSGGGAGGQINYTMGTVTVAADTVGMLVQHNLGKVPNFAMIINNALGGTSTTQKNPIYSHLCLAVFNNRVITAKVGTSTTNYVYRVVDAGMYPITATQMAAQYQNVNEATETSINFGHNQAGGSKEVYGFFPAGASYTWIVGVLEQ